MDTQLPMIMEMATQHLTIMDILRMTMEAIIAVVVGQQAVVEEGPVAAEEGPVAAVEEGLVVVEEMIDGIELTIYQ